MRGEESTPVSDGLPYTCSKCGTKHIHLESIRSNGCAVCRHYTPVKVGTIEKLPDHTNPIPGTVYCVKCSHTWKKFDNANCPNCEKSTPIKQDLWHTKECDINLIPHGDCTCGFNETVNPQSRSCMEAQQGGNHYQLGAIQPIEYIHANELNFFEGNAIKYVTRNRRKGSPVEDLKKAIHYLQLQLKLIHNLDSRIEYDAIHRD